MARVKKDRKAARETMALLSTGEVAGIFGVHPNTIRRWVEEGKLRAERVGSRQDRKFRREVVAEFYLDLAIQNYLHGK